MFNTKRKYKVADLLYLVDNKEIFHCFISDYCFRKTRYLVGLSEKVSLDGSRETINCYKYPRGFRVVSDKNLYPTFKEVSEQLKKRKKMDTFKLSNDYNSIEELENIIKQHLTPTENWLLEHTMYGWIPYGDNVFLRTVEKHILNKYAEDPVINDAVNLWNYVQIYFVQPLKINPPSFSGFGGIARFTHTFHSDILTLILHIILHDKVQDERDILQAITLLDDVSIRAWDNIFFRFDAGEQFKKQINIFRRFYQKELYDIVSPNYGPLLTDKGYCYKNTSLTDLYISIFRTVMYRLLKWHEKAHISDEINDTNVSEQDDIIEILRAINNSLYATLGICTVPTNPEVIKEYAQPLIECEERLKQVMKGE